MNYLKITSWTLAVLFALSSIPTDAEAIASKRKKDTKEQVQEEKFPGATREEPPQKYTNASSSNRIKKLGDLYNTEGKEQQTIEAAKEIWTNPKSNAFERALAYQLAGNAAYNLDDITLAIDYLKKAVEEDALSNNSHFQSMQQIASFYINDGLYEESIPSMIRSSAERTAAYCTP